MKSPRPGSMKLGHAGLVFICLHLIVFPFRLNAWCLEGHALIEKIAWHYMNSAVKDSVQKQLSCPAPDAQIKLDAGKKTNQAFLEHTRCFPETDQSAVSLQPTILLNKTELLIYTLKNRFGTLAERGENLRLLMQLVGDLHQPLHATSDSWGHELKYPVGQSDREESLYQIWNHLLLRSAGVSLETCLAIRFNKAAWRRYYTPDPADKTSALKQISNTPSDWQNLSSHLLQFIQPEPHSNINQTYFLKCKPILELQLHNAGLNLANVLRRIYSNL